MWSFPNYSWQKEPALIDLNPEKAIETTEHTEREDLRLARVTTSMVRQVICASSFHYLRYSVFSTGNRLFRLKSVMWENRSLGSVRDLLFNQFLYLYLGTEFE